MSPELRQKSQEAYPEPVLAAVEMMGELMEYWGFKRIHGALWAMLYLEKESLTQLDLVKMTGYSKGAISMALGELQDWGVVRVKRPLRGRGMTYTAETDLAAMIRNVIMRRERELLRQAQQRFDNAARFAADQGGETGQFRAERLRVLSGLTSAAIWTLDRFVSTGALPFSRLRTFFQKGLGSVSTATRTRGQDAL